MSLLKETRSPLQYWNWKAGVLSAAGRGLLFVALTISHGHRTAMAAFSIEALFRVISSGFYGAITQAFRNIRPAWLGVVLFAVVLPVLVQTADYAVHATFSTPNLVLGSVISCVWTGIASLFDWYAMRQGVLVTGSGSQSLWADVKCMPDVVSSAVRDLFGRREATEFAIAPPAEAPETDR